MKTSYMLNGSLLIAEPFTIIHLEEKLMNQLDEDDAFKTKVHGLRQLNLYLHTLIPSLHDAQIRLNVKQVPRRVM